MLTALFTFNIWHCCTDHPKVPGPSTTVSASPLILLFVSHFIPMAQYSNFCDPRLSTCQHLILSLVLFLYKSHRNEMIWPLSFLWLKLLNTHDAFHFHSLCTDSIHHFSPPCTISPCLCVCIYIKNSVYKGKRGCPRHTHIISKNNTLGLEMVQMWKCLHIVNWILSPASYMSTEPALSTAGCDPQSLKWKDPYS